MKTKLSKKLLIIAWIASIVLFWFLRKEQPCSNFVLWDCNVDRHILIPLLWSILTGGLIYVLTKTKNIIVKSVIGLILLYFFSFFIPIRSSLPIQTNKCDDFTDEAAKDICYISLARTTLNYEYCNKIQDQSTYQMCQVNVYYWDKTEDFCAKEDQKDICLDIISLRDNDKGICNKIDNTAIRKMCKKRKDW